MQQINILAFEPPFKNFKEAIIGILDHLVESIMTIERLETKLYLDFQKGVSYLKVRIFLKRYGRLFDLIISGFY